MGDNAVNQEPIVWRPNSISQEEWDSKSRERQIAWWRETCEKDEINGKRSMIDILKFYEEGVITLSGCTSMICKRANHNEIPDFLNQCPAEIITHLRKFLHRFQGNDPEKWPRSFFMGSYAPWMTVDQIEACKNNEQQLQWNGVTILKQYLD